MPGVCGNCRARDEDRHNRISLPAELIRFDPIRGLLTAEAGAVLRAVLDPLAAPRPAAAAPEQPDESATGDAAPPEPDELLTDERSPGQRMADALVELSERALAQGELPASGGQRPQLVVTMDYDHLATGLGAGVLPDGTQLSPAAVRRLACDAGVLPAVLGSAGQVLDLGRTARTASPAQRRALALRDGGCDFPGRDRPPASTEAHHIQYWEDFGPTDLDNLVALCGHTTATSTTTAGRSSHPRTASDRCSSHHRGSTPNGDPEEMCSTTPEISSDHPIPLDEPAVRPTGQPFAAQPPSGRAA